MTTLQPPAPIIIADLWEPLLAALLGLLASLTPEEWATPNVCGAWTAHETATHLLGGDVGILSRGRDGYRVPGPLLDGWDDMVRFINALNDQWIVATRRISPRVLCMLLRATGTEVAAYFRSLDPHALGGAVSWAGPGPAPVWLDLAREYTERWHHQQQIRRAVGKAGADDPRLVAPVLDAFVRALPHTYRDIAAPDGTTVALTVEGAAGGAWVLRRDGEGWTLLIGTVATPTASVRLPQDIAWRLWTKGITPDAARPHTAVEGDHALGEPVLHMVSVIA
jgi:uncharacterized protein (TIGR03083 family)